MAETTRGSGPVNFGVNFSNYPIQSCGGRTDSPLGSVQTQAAFLWVEVLQNSLGPPMPSVARRAGNKHL